VDPFITGVLISGHRFGNKPLIVFTQSIYDAKDPDRTADLPPLNILHAPRDHRKRLRRLRVAA